MPHSLCQDLQQPLRDNHAGWCWLDALAEDLERRNRRLLLVSGSQGQGATIETDFPQWESGAQLSMPSRLSEIQSEVVDMTAEDSDADEDVEVECLTHRR